MNLYLEMVSQCRTFGWCWCNWIEDLTHETTALEKYDWLTARVWLQIVQSQKSYGECVWHYRQSVPMPDDHHAAATRQSYHHSSVLSCPPQLATPQKTECRPVSRQGHPDTHELVPGIWRDNSELPTWRKLPEIYDICDTASSSCVDSYSRVSTGDAARSFCCRCFLFFCVFCCRRLTDTGTCTLSGTLSSSEELLTSAGWGGGGGGGGAAACFELFAWVGRSDPFGGMVEVVWSWGTAKTKWRKEIQRSVLSIRTLSVLPTPASVLST